MGLTLALGLTACSSQGGAQEEQASGGAAGGGGVDTERYTIAMITHEAAGDTFWDKIRTGAEDAAGALNIDLQYTNNPEAPEMATLVQNAVDQQVDGIASSLAFPEAVGPALQAAGDAGIPTVAFNSGLDQYQRYGALMYFGSDERVAGNAVGKRLTDDGAQKAICVITEQGNVALETRCDGVRDTFPNTENLQVEGTDAASVRQTIGAKLQQDPAITHIVSLGAPYAMISLDAITDAGSEAEVVTFDLNAEAAQAIADGRIAFTVDQQPYVQGFMAVQSLWLNLTNGNDLGGGQPVLTGPSFVDQDNIDQILPYAQKNTR
jgi:simple sugar transport system substrate-binding protein